MKPEDFGIKNYEWVNGKLNVRGDVRLAGTRLNPIEKPPFKFGKVTGNFICGCNKMNSLKGAPEEVSGTFFCNDNQLISLEGAPKIVKGSFHCQNNKIISLKGAPEEVGGNFLCYNNPLTPLELLKTLFVNGELPAKYHGLAEKIEPAWENLLELEKQGSEESEEEDLLKALERVSK